jgi:hypothetical protein
MLAEQLQTKQRYHVPNLKAWKYVGSALYEMRIMGDLWNIDQI